MARVSIISTLPADVRQELTRRIIANGYGGYHELTAWLQEQGYAIEKSSVHRFGQELKERRGDVVDTEIGLLEKPDFDLVDIRMRCVEAAVQAGEPDVLKASQTYLDWVTAV